MLACPCLVPVLLAVRTPTEPLLCGRKAKASLLEVDLPALQKLVKKGKTTPEQLKDREAKVWLLLLQCFSHATHPGGKRFPLSRCGLAQVVEVKAAIEGIADGVHGARRIPGKARLLSSGVSS